MDFGMKEALGIMLVLNCMFFFLQLGVDEASEGAGPQYWNYQGSLISDYDGGNYELKEFDPTDLPDGQAGVTEEGNFFTDIFSTIKNWVLDIPGVKYILGFINAIPNFLKLIGLPVEISFALGFIWQAMSVVLFILWVKG